MLASLVPSARSVNVVLVAVLTFIAGVGLGANIDLAKKAVDRCLCAPAPCECPAEPAKEKCGCCPPTGAEPKAPCPCLTGCKCGTGEKCFCGLCACRKCPGK